MIVKGRYAKQMYEMLGISLELKGNSGDKTEKKM
jgi:hypothetical protein